MLLVAPVQEDKRLPSTEQQSLEGFAKLKVARSTVPAITHVDYSARVQTVDRHRNSRMHQLMSLFKDRTNCPVVINTVV